MKFLAIPLALAALCAPSHAAKLQVFPTNPQPGDVLTLTIWPQNGEKISGVGMNAFDTKNVQFFARTDGSVRGYVGLPFDRTGGNFPISARVQTQNGEQLVSANVAAKARAFPTQRFNMKSKGNAAKMNQTAKLRAERIYVQSKLKSSHPVPLWSGNWIVPTRGPQSSPYGRKRWINGKWWGQHNGTDIKAPTGTPIRAMNAGRVVLSEYLPTLRGHCVAIDHGANVFSLYIHCARRDVREGENVQKGQQIATVGSTGFSTGPHLHFEVRVGWEPVDPMRVIARGMG